MTDSDRDRRDGFLSRWSERKRAVRDHEAAEEQAAENIAEAAQEGDDTEMLAANRAEAEAIDLDGLTSESDFSPFFKTGVPAALKSAALKKLWRSHPVFACLDGLNDYDENFADPARIMKVAKSSWEVGSGYAKRYLELEEQAKEMAAKAERAIESLPASEEAPVAETIPEQQAAEIATADPAEIPESAEEAEEGEVAAAEEAEPTPRVSLRTRLDFAAFKDEG